MCRIVHASIYIVNECVKNGIPIDYFKVQKLAYISQCRHLGVYGVPLAPETVWNWSYGAGFKEIYHFFNDNNLIDGDMIEPIYRELDLLSFEKDTINAALKNYGGLSFEELTVLTKTDPVFSQTPIGKPIPIERITEFFINNAGGDETWNINV